MTRRGEYGDQVFDEARPRQSIDGTVSDAHPEPMARRLAFRSAGGRACRWHEARVAAGRADCPDRRRNRCGGVDRAGRQTTSARRGFRKGVRGWARGHHGKAADRVRSDRGAFSQRGRAAHGCGRHRAQTRSAERTPTEQKPNSAVLSVSQIRSEPSSASAGFDLDQRAHAALGQLVESDWQHVSDRDRGAPRPRRRRRGGADRATPHLPRRRRAPQLAHRHADHLPPRTTLGRGPAVCSGRG